jgi:ABC-type antimicrobial peptide transport system permease subunit
VEIVGVVANSKYRTLGEARNAAIYTPYLQAHEVDRMVRIVVRTSASPQSLAAAIRDTILRADPSVALSVQPMSSALAFAFMPSRIGAALFGAMGALASLLAMVGIYAVLSFAVGCRTAEIGIRIALGASRASVALMVLKDTAVVVGMGLAVGLLAAILIAGPLAAFVVAGLRPTDPWHLAGTAAIVLTITLLAVWGPARRAVRIEPATALRAE